VSIVRVQDFLQEQDVGSEPVQALAQLMDDHAPRKLREAFVDVVRRNGEARRLFGGALGELLARRERLQRCTFSGRVALFFAHNRHVSIARTRATASVG
jgi:hypothetical protein